MFLLATVSTKYLHRVLKGTNKVTYSQQNKIKQLSNLKRVKARYHWCPHIFEVFITHLLQCTHVHLWSVEPSIKWFLFMHFPVTTLYRLQTNPSQQIYLALLEITSLAYTFQSKYGKIKHSPQKNWSSGKFSFKSLDRCRLLTTSARKRMSYLPKPSDCNRLVTVRDSSTF